MKILIFIFLFFIFLAPNAYADYEIFECKFPTEPSAETFKINYDNGLMYYVETGYGTNINYFEEYKRKGNSYIISPNMKNLMPKMVPRNPEQMNKMIELLYDLKLATEEILKNAELTKEEKKETKLKLKQLVLEIKYLETTNLNIEIDNKRKVAKLYLDEPPSLIREKWYEKPDIAECLSKLITSSMKWKGYIISVFDAGMTKGLEQESKMIFPSSTTYHTQGECMAEFGYLFKNDPALIEKYPQATDTTKSYLFGCIQK